MENCDCKKEYKEADATELFEKLGLLIGSVAVAVLNCVWIGYVLSILWKWFIVTLGVPAISITQAIGLSLFVWAISPVDADVKDRTFGSLILGSFLKALLALGMGYVIHLFM